MAERARLVRLYGPELLSEEEKAVMGLMRMLNYQHRIDSSSSSQQQQLNATTISLRNASIVMAHDESSLQQATTTATTTATTAATTATTTTIISGHEEGDVYLPPFVYQLLERLRLLTKTSSDGRDVMDDGSDDMDDGSAVVDQR